MNALDLIRQEQANNRNKFAQKVKAEQEAAEAQQQFAATYLGSNADTGNALAQIAGGGAVPCATLSDRYIKPGQTVMVTLPLGASQGFIDTMTT